MLKYTRIILDLERPLSAEEIGRLAEDIRCQIADLLRDARPFGECWRCAWWMPGANGQGLCQYIGRRSTVMHPEARAEMNPIPGQIVSLITAATFGCAEFRAAERNGEKGQP